MVDGQYLTSQEIAEQIGQSHANTCRLMSDGLLPAIRIYQDSRTHLCCPQTTWQAWLDAHPAILSASKADRQRLYRSIREQRMAAESDDDETEEMERWQELFARYEETRNTADLRAALHSFRAEHPCEQDLPTLIYETCRPARFYDELVRRRLISKCPMALRRTKAMKLGKKFTERFLQTY